ncbi:MAG TPA: FAD-binding oxidoreductase [Solirubrobacteraceae bacterium]|nr:FAD-binding oxidoreductase [Solirubrobacteraceae bacterium]
MPEARALRPATLYGWGNADRVRGWRWSPASAEELAAGLADAANEPRLTRGAIPRGMGRSYGDAAQRWGGVAIDTTRLTRIHIDPASGRAEVGAGVVLGDLMAAAAPLGWLVPVVPGTQFVSVGGAIASDIHGKNHGSVGTFGQHVRELTLALASGELRRLGSEDPLFGATLGGMGLTGVVVSATLQLSAGPPLVSVDTDRVEGLEATLEALRADGGPHRVAWLDLLSRRGPRAVVTRARVLGAEEAAALTDPPRRGTATVPVRLRVPPVVPSGVLRPEFIAAANAARFRRSPRRARDEVMGFAAHMFPLDGLAAWPRLYGPAGFLQYQIAVPPAQSAVMERVLGILGDARVPVYLAVLKDFGPATVGADLSFPIEGWTLALDLPRRHPGLPAALDRCDELVASSGGRVYLTKDSRMRPDTVAAMYPHLARWRALRDGADPDGLWASDLALRTGLVEAAG